MRKLVGIICLFALGCGGAPTPPEPDMVTISVENTPPKTCDEAACCGCCSDETAASSQSSSDWPGFLGPLGTSVSTEKGIIAPWPEAGPRLLWRQSLGSGYGMPSIAKGRLFVFDRLDDQARLRCLDSATGEYRWQFTYPTDYKDMYGYSDGPRCCPVIDGARVYILGAEGMLHCLKTKDGELDWKVDTKAKFGVVQNFFGVGSSPVIEGGLLLVQVGGSATPKARISLHLKGNGTGIVAFDKLTGKVKYQVSDELASYAGPVLATIGERRWCFVFARGGLLGFEPSSGKIDFHLPWRSQILESVNASNPVVVGDRVFISETYGPGSALLKVKEGGYDVLWSDAAKEDEDKSMQCHWNTPIHHKGYVYGCSGRHPYNAQLRCIELDSGKVKWSQEKLSRTSLLMVDGHFLCLSEMGQLLLLRVNAEKYEEVSRIDIRRLEHPDASDEERKRLPREPFWAAPAIANGLLYIRGDEALRCYEAIPVVK